MNLGKLSYFALASKRLDWLAARQRVVSENIASADTPGARAKDVQSFEAFLDTARPSSGTGRASPKLLNVNDSWVQAPDGNNISIEQQTILATRTAQDHGLASRLYAKGHAMLILAASGQ